METRTTQPIRNALLASVVCIFGGIAPGSAWAASPSVGYVTDSGGNIVRDNYGDCVRTSDWRPEVAVRECDADVFAAFERQAPDEPEQMERITLDADTQFDFDAATLTDRGKRDLDRVVEAAKTAEEPEVRISGYTDRIGPETYNEDLSKRRAEAVRDYLVQNGIPENAVTVSAQGEKSPIVSCEGMTGDALIDCLRPNRRSEVEFAGFEVKEESDPGSAFE